MTTYAMPFQDLGNGSNFPGTNTCGVTFTPNWFWEVIVVGILVCGGGGSVAGVTDTLGLTWQKKGAYTFGDNDFEIWWANTYNLTQVAGLEAQTGVGEGPLSGAYVDTITATFNGSPTSTAMGGSVWAAVDPVTTWDANASFVIGTGVNFLDPSAFSAGQPTFPNAMQQTGISTSSSNTTILNFIAGPELALYSNGHGGINGMAWNYEFGGAGLGTGPVVDYSDDSITYPRSPVINLQYQSFSTPQSGLSIDWVDSGVFSPIDESALWIMVSVALIGGPGAAVTGNPAVDSYTAPITVVGPSETETSVGTIYGMMNLTENQDWWGPSVFLGSGSVFTAPEITGTGPLPSPDTYGGDYGTGTGTTTAPYSTGLSPGYPLPFLFAWVDAGENMWDYSMARVDEEILSIDLKHEEGQIPTLEIEIRNPRIGLLNPSRKQWAWLAYQPPPTSPGPAPFLAAGDFSAIPNGYGSPGATNNTAPSDEGTPEYVVDGYVRPGYQFYDGAVIPITPPVLASPPSLESPPEPVLSDFLPGDTIIPIFFGELIGVPSDLFGERITLKFLARPMNYIEAKQAVAEKLKIPGNYEPIFMDEKQRDDPDSILEGWSSLFHVDRVTQEVTVSDILVGEDGTNVFAESPPSAIYKSLKVKIGQAPLTNVQILANVHWQQRSQGYVTGPNVSVQTYTGTTFMSDWPKSGKALGAGWTVEASYVDDPYMVEHVPNWHWSTSTTFGEGFSYNMDGERVTPPDCSVSAQALTQSGPALLGAALTAQGVVLNQPGICVSQVSHNMDGSPTSQQWTIPVKLNTLSVFVPLWSLNCSWTLRYNAKREYYEMATIDVTANTQAILTSPTVEQDSLLIKMDGEVGQPIILYDAWSDFANQVVPTGTIIYPNNPTTAGGLSYQYCEGGLTGTVEPQFSDIPGTITVDNEASWISLGPYPQSNIQRMAFCTSYTVGTILYYQPQIFDIYQGTMVDSSAVGAYCIITSDGESTNCIPTLITYDPPISSSDEILFPHAPVTVAVETFTPIGAPISTLSFEGIPVGGSADNVIARTFFSTARGQQSLIYGINRARAKIRMRSRAVDVSWDCPFDMVVGMSCRQNATIFDPRLPGGVATGKVTSYGMTAKGGKMRGHVTIGCAVGYNSFGNPGADISYTPGAGGVFDDGLSFPLSHLPCSGTGGGYPGSGTFSGTSQTQGQLLSGPEQAYLAAMLLGDPQEPLSEVEAGAAGLTTTVSLGVDAGTAWQIAIDQAELQESMEANPVMWSTEIQSVINGPFSGSYVWTVTPLEIPMGINLTAASQE